MITIAIVDDNPFYIGDVKRHLSLCIENIEYEVFEYTKADDFIFDIDIKKFDVVFLDILLDKNNGIELGSLINEKQPESNIIFMSSNPDYFKDVYKVDHSYFLTKEFEEDRFCDAVNKFVKKMHKNVITVSVKKEQYKINLDDIIIIEAYLRKTLLHNINGEVTEYNINIKEIEKKLSDSTFVRVHQSYIVNMQHIKRYSRQTIFMAKDKSVPISRTYIHSAKEKITFFLGGML